MSRKVLLVRPAHRVRLMNNFARIKHLRSPARSAHASFSSLASQSLYYQVLRASAHASIYTTPVITESDDMEFVFERKTNAPL